MRQPTAARVAAALAGSVLAVIVGSGANANATTVEFPQVPTMASGGICWTSLRTWADTNEEWPGRAILNIRALPVTGVGSGSSYPLAPLCEVRATVAWRNTDTGAVGAYQQTVVTGMYGSIQHALFQDTGPGHVEVTVTTNNASIPARGSFEVPG